jgi:hypothetical protein
LRVGAVEEVTRAVASLLELLGVIRERAEVRKKIAELLGRRFRLDAGGEASFAYVKTLGEPPSGKRELLELLREYSYAPYGSGVRVRLAVYNTYVYLTEEAEDATRGIIDHGVTTNGVPLSFFLKLALYFDEEDWEEMKRLAREKLREESELLEKLKTAAATVELLLTK